VGEYFGLASGFFGEAGISQIGIQAAVFALFNLDAPSSDLVNADYWIGLPLSYRRGPWSYLIRLYHQSSHLGDEFILGNPGINRVNLSYEDLVNNTEEAAKKLLAYCGLEWNDQCLQFYATRREVKTASQWQVRQPVYKSSLDRWKQYDKHIGQLKEILAGYY